MPFGFFTIEQWQSAHSDAPAHWRPILHLDADQSLTKAMEALQSHGEPGLFRVVQMQRCIWAEVEDGELHLHASHASSAENLGEIVEIFERENGRRPTANARRHRAKAKADRKCE